MRELFVDIYNKVITFFTPDKDEIGENSKDTACNRLKLVLMHDRVKMDPLIMQKMREEMIEVLSKYVEIDKEELNLDLAGEGDSIALMLNIPVLRAKTSEEIEEYEQKLKEKLAAEIQEATEEDDAEVIDLSNADEVVESEYERLATDLEENQNGEDAIEGVNDEASNQEKSVEAELNN